MSPAELRNALRPVGDQGSRGTCVAFAVTAVHEEAVAAADETDPEDLSEEVLFWGAKQIDGDDSNGTRFTSANLALQRWGQPAEALWPYDALRDHRSPSYRPPDPAIDPANCRFSALVPIPSDVPSLRAQLDMRRPVVLGIPVWDGLRSAASEPLPAPQPHNLYPTRHAVVLVGYDGARRALLIRNSWGPTWGDNGHLWISDDVAPFFSTAWSVDSSTKASAAVDPDEEILSRGTENGPS